jgi:hypothetical protein
MSDQDGSRITGCLITVLLFAIGIMLGALVYRLGKL